MLTEEQLQQLDEAYDNCHHKEQHRKLLEDQVRLPKGVRYACRNWMFLPSDYAIIGKHALPVRVEIARCDDDWGWELGEKIPQEMWEATLKKFDTEDAVCYQIIRCVGKTMSPRAARFGAMRMNTEGFSNYIYPKRSQNPREHCVQCLHFGYENQTDAYCCCPYEVRTLGPNYRYGTNADFSGD